MGGPAIKACNILVCLTNLGGALNGGVMNYQGGNFLIFAEPFSVVTLNY